MSATAPDDFASYVAERGPALRRFAYLASGGSADSSDLVQDALERAYPRWRALVGVILDCAEATARSHVHRALAALRERIGEEAPDE